MKDLQTHFSPVRRHTGLWSSPEWKTNTASPKMHLYLLPTTELNESPWKQNPKEEKGLILYKIEEQNSPESF